MLKAGYDAAMAPSEVVHALVQHTQAMLFIDWLLYKSSIVNPGQMWHSAT